MEQVICQGHWQETPGLAFRADVPTIQLMGYKTSQGEIRGAVQWGVPAKGAAQCPTLWARVGTGVSPGHLVLCGRAPPAKGGAAVPEGDQEQGPTRALVPHYWEGIPLRRQWDDASYDCKLTKAREAHQWGLAAAHLLKERIKRLSQSATRTKQGNHWHSHSQGHLRRWSRGQCLRCTKTPSGGDHQRDLRGRQTQSPSPRPTRPWKHVTFQDSELSSGEGPSMRWHAGQSPDRRKAEECDLGPPPTLEPKLEHSLGESADV